MTGQSPGPGWWLASDGQWYPPETAPDLQGRPAAATAPSPSAGPNGYVEPSPSFSPPSASPTPATAPGSANSQLLVAAVVAVVAIAVIGVLIAASIIVRRPQAETLSATSGPASTDTSPLGSCTTLVKATFISDMDTAIARPGTGSPAMMALLTTPSPDAATKAAIKALNAIYQRHGDIISSYQHQSPAWRPELEMAARTECQTALDR